MIFCLIFSSWLALPYFDSISSFWCTIWKLFVVLVSVFWSWTCLCGIYIICVPQLGQGIVYCWVWYRFWGLCCDRFEPLVTAPLDLLFVKVLVLLLLASGRRLCEVVYLSHSSGFRVWRLFCVFLSLSFTLEDVKFFSLGSSVDSNFCCALCVLSEFFMQNDSLVDSFSVSMLHDSLLLILLLLSLSLLDMLLPWSVFCFLITVLCFSCCCIWLEFRAYSLRCQFQ